MFPARFGIVGDNCVDRFQPPVAQSLIGGNAINVAVQLALLGHDVSYFGAVGIDKDGARTRDLLRANGVRTDHLREVAGNTAFTNIDITETGERIFAHEDFGVCKDYIPDAEDLQALLAMDHVHLGWIADDGLVRRRLAAGGCSLSQDVSVNNDPVHLGVAGLSVAFGSAGEDGDAADAMMAQFLADGARLAVVTRGARGSCATDGATRVETGIAPVDVVDTTGAGDSFIAGFLHAMMDGRDLQDCLVAGRSRAAVTCTHVGGFPQDIQPL
ncbi:PfkB family carbohydrate kinase [Rhizobium sp. Leaf341]|uniref:PfkB family carbohydrate kinase n=1 Tax=Rhizobium sp. Leaf341 TaxID=1736344 RepID=UPI000713E652|nr:PfkB family carbohydrate kinase [Rhizobium sp. Leaf341]KQR70034.1 kinase [Rhizobium sp. Leaf341]